MDSNAGSPETLRLALRVVPVVPAPLAASMISPWTDGGRIGANRYRFLADSPGSPADRIRPRASAYIPTRFDRVDRVLAVANFLEHFGVGERRQYAVPRQGLDQRHPSAEAIEQASILS